MPAISLTTDFGGKDWFVGTMKGVILRIHPRAEIVDLTHEIPAGDVRSGAFALAAGYSFFPRGTVHVAVVDPGVGSARKAVAVQTANYCFVGPDNGVLSWALARERIKAIRVLENERYFVRPVSRTFHGRDIFAPVAAHLSRGLSLKKLGSATKELVRLTWPQLRREGRGVRGQILYLDRFGNAITNIDAAALPGAAEARMQVWRGRKRLCRLGDFYEAVPRGRAIAVFGSSGFLEIAIHGGSAAERLGLRVGDALTVM